jgi:hypothetical protein
MTNIHIFGDSHVRTFFGRFNKINMTNYTIYNEFKSAVSISGINNFESKTGYGNYIYDYITNKNINDIFVFKLGQVDIETIFYYKIYIKKENITFNDFINNLLKQYINYIKKIINLNYKNIIITSTNLPIKNNFLNMIRKKINKSINIEYEDICKNFTLFNNKLEDICKVNNIYFLDLINYMSIKNNNNNICLLKNDLYGKDHHIKGSEQLNLLKKIRMTNTNYGIAENQFFLNILLNFIFNKYNFNFNLPNLYYIHKQNIINSDNTIIKKPIIKKPIHKNNIIKKPILKKPILKKPIPKKPIPKKPIPKKPIPKKH